MPIINGEYIAPTWVNGQNPPIDAQEMQDICDSVAKNQAPTSHASPTKDYGVGNASNYGHVKLSDQADMSLGQSFGVAATPQLVALVNDTAHDASLKANQALELAGGKADATVTGTYQGTGTWGANNKNSLEFGKIIPSVIYISNKPDKSNSAVLIVLVPPLKIGYSFYNSADSTGADATRWNTLLEVGAGHFVTPPGHTYAVVSWYAKQAGAGAQGNNLGETYTYVAMY